MRKATGCYRTYSIPSETAALVPEFAVKDPPSTELQPRFLALAVKNLSLGRTFDDDDEDETTLYRIFKIIIKSTQVKHVSVYYFLTRKVFSFD